MSFDTAPLTELPVWLQRGIKTHVRAREHTFFAACPPGFESVVSSELNDLGISERRETAGGVEFTSRMETLYRANLFLRSAGRVWMRVDEFRAGAISELFRRIRTIRWETLLLPGTPLHIQMYLRSSRINHSGQATETVIDALRTRWRDAAHEHGHGGELLGMGTEAPEQMVLVSIENNRCRISLDSSGEHLHRRGYRLETAKAPIRETLAAGLILASGWKGEPFFDPMCGSGTFPIEAALMAHRVPPGIGRRFAFMNWPVYSDPQWNHLLRSAREDRDTSSEFLIAGRDTAAGAVRISTANAERAEVAESIRFEQGDFFSPDVPPPFPEPGFLFLNAPYGHRVPKPGGGTSFLARLKRLLARSYREWRVVVLVPQETPENSLGATPARVMHLDNGGIPVAALFL